MSWLPDDIDDDDDKYADYEARNRPNPKGNRARTKTRPEHLDAVTGRVLTVDRGRYAVLVNAGAPDEHEAIASRARSACWETSAACATSKNWATARSLSSRMVRMGGSCGSRLAEASEPQGRGTAFLPWGAGGPRMKIGDKVRWHWGSGTAQGTVTETFAGPVTRRIKGSEITRNGSAEDHALLITQQDGETVLKLASEVERA